MARVKKKFLDMVAGIRIFTPGRKIKTDLVGNRFGKLVVTQQLGSDQKSRLICSCLCDCGKKKIVRADSLISGGTTSCNCELSKNGFKHGYARRLTKDNVYSVWCGMKSRCSDPAHIAYKWYGGRGIKVCDSWIKSFERFLSDMGPRPTGLTIERKNNDGNYEPGNCIWADWKTQIKNRRSRGPDKPITWNGETKAVSVWAKQIGMTDATLRCRLRRWSIERALTIPKRRYLRSGL